MMKCTPLCTCSRILYRERCLRIEWCTGTALDWDWTLGLGLVLVLVLVSGWCSRETIERRTVYLAS